MKTINGVLLLAGTGIFIGLMAVSIPDNEYKPLTQYNKENAKLIALKCTGNNEFYMKSKICGDK